MPLNLSCVSPPPVPLQFNVWGRFVGERAPQVITCQTDVGTQEQLCPKKKKKKKKKKKLRGKTETKKKKKQQQKKKKK
eukprot:NODE_23999_length_642_cov_4.438835.p4 GENE.NODE_23999_length_642_cov_4.438835~~NODE_23999_length_642_cov_4.438835.p4  ORF type:complete len:78 (-),score=42.68 NODE_23999_length_642_cov_4.438835:32-265(-)